MFGYSSVIYMVMQVLCQHGDGQMDEAVAKRRRVTLPLCQRPLGNVLRKQCVRTTDCLEDRWHCSEHGCTHKQLKWNCKHALPHNGDPDTTMSLSCPVHGNVPFVSSSFLMIFRERA